MILFLIEKITFDFPGINLFSYLSFRAGCAILTSLVIVFIIGPKFIKTMNNQQGKGRKMRSEDVELPGEDKKAGGPSFRQELLDAAKQDAPQNYEEAVRKYYQELIK